MGVPWCVVAAVTAVWRWALHAVVRYLDATHYSGIRLNRRRRGEGSADPFLPIKKNDKKKASTAGATQPLNVPEGRSRLVPRMNGTTTHTHEHN